MTGRRFFLRSLGAVAVLASAGGAWFGIRRATASREAFLIEPDGERFAYVDGWVVKVDDVR
jgi:hypothetical protein